MQCDGQLDRAEAGGEVAAARADACGSGTRAAPRRARGRLGSGSRAGRRAIRSRASSGTGPLQQAHGGGSLHARPRAASRAHAVRPAWLTARSASCAQSRARGPRARASDRGVASSSAGRRGSQAEQRSGRWACRARRRRRCVLPSSTASPSTSRMSSWIWNARPISAP